MSLKIEKNSILNLFFILSIVGCGEPASDNSETASEPTPVNTPVESEDVLDADSTEASDVIVESNVENTVDTSFLSDTETQESGTKGIRFTGIVQYWETDEPATDCTVCVHEQDECSSALTTGMFTLNNVPADSNVIFTFNCEKSVPTAFPLSTGDTDTVGDIIFVVREKSSIDLMMQESDVSESWTPEKTMILFQAGPKSFPQGRGIPGVTVSYFGPDPGKATYYTIPTPNQPGFAVGGKDVSSTSIAGEGFIPNLKEGKYLLTFADAGTENRTCDSRWGWLQSGDEYPPNTFEVPLIDGYVSMASVGCETSNTVSSTGKVLEFIFSIPLPGIEMCVSWDRQMDGSYASEMCESTDESGQVVHTNLPGDQQFLLEGQGNLALGYMSTIGTMETYTGNIEWLGFAMNKELIKASAGAAGLEFNPTKGHIIASVVNQYRLPLQGFSMKLLNSVVTPDYVDGNDFDSTALATADPGLAIFFNVDPDTHTLVVEKEGVLCTVSNLSWYSKRGYVAPVKPATITIIEVVCLDDPTPVFSEPSTPITSPSCDAAEVSERCVELCTYLKECSMELCDAFDNLSEWEAAGAIPGTQLICEDLCKTPDTKIVENMCNIDTCNTMLMYAHFLNGDLDYICDNGIPNVLIMASVGENVELVGDSFAVFLDSPGIQAAMNSENLYTLLMPTNEALAALDAETTNKLNTDETFREQVLANHLVLEPYSKTDFFEALASGTENLSTLGGEIVLTPEPGGGVFIDGATLVVTDIYAKNGFVHFIDKVLIPSDLQ